MQRGGVVGGSIQQVQQLVGEACALVRSVHPRVDPHKAAQRQLAHHIGEGGQRAAKYTAWPPLLLLLPALLLLLLLGGGELVTQRVQLGAQEGDEGLRKREGSPCFRSRCL